jgi:hypothetical protein
MSIEVVINFSTVLSRHALRSDEFIRHVTTKVVTT